MIKNNGYPDLTLATRFIDNNLYEKFIRGYCEKDDVLITLVGNGISNVCLFPSEKSVIIQNTLGLKFEDDKRFKYYSFLAKQNEIKKLDRGMAQPSIKMCDLLEITFKIPSVKEQVKVSTLFWNIDSLITLHQCK